MQYFPPAPRPTDLSPRACSGGGPQAFLPPGAQLPEARRGGRPHHLPLLSHTHLSPGSKLPKVIMKSFF